MKKQRWVVLGIDGASFNIIFPLIERGLLPNFARLLREGSHARLTSVIPWQTPVAWTSFATGVNPGGHGIYGWWSPNIDSGKLRPSSGRDVTASRFWEILSSNGIRVGIVNVPMSYPARPVNGFFISGFDCPWAIPEMDPSFSYPRRLEEQLREEGIDYQVIPWPLRQNDPLGMVAKWREVETARIKATIALQKKFAPDYLQVNLFLTDYIAHRTKLGDEALDIAYQVADELTGQLLAAAGPETTFLVVSDHGSCSINKFVMIHNLLQDLGLLRFKPWLADEQVAGVLGAEATVDEVASLTARLQREGATLREAMYREVQSTHPGANIGFTTIDWDQTKVYCTSDYGQIRINHERGAAAVHQESEATAILNQISQAFLKLEDPETRKLLIETVFDRDHLYQGHLASAGPDLTPILTDHSYYFCQVYSFYRTGEKRVVAPIAEVVEPVSSGSVGDHHPHGILMAVGPAVAAGVELPDASILDLAPTILQSFGLGPQPEHEGSILGELFGFPRVPAQQKTPSTNELESGLRERLQALGYKI